jgi:folate-binding protein YgfZ
MQKPYAAETLVIEGADAIAFAHAQFSSNVLVLATGRWQFSAWLDAQGRVRVFFQLARVADDQLLILLRGGNAAATAESLRRFVFRSKVTVTALPLRSLSTGTAATAYSIQRSGDDLLLGCGDHSLRISDDRASDDAWRLPQLHAGWPWLPNALLSELLSPALSLQRLQAVVIDKGCYPGQEIVARMHFRGAHKKHLYRVQLSRAAMSGERLRINAHDKGWLLDVVIGDTTVEALAVLDDDVVTHAVYETLHSVTTPSNDGDGDFTIRLQETWNA